ncbi:hypothetical protein T8T21_00795 [Limimaricola variabilis]|uniref:hypothetical protein n=1 Tax=Limimaricola variabilis TaxID=1492771 RepID=UPI002AC97C7A|nr:hypothetical protein [Limimaricola variabilis]WPY94696.1 hypothetical protein T8T21_00795 [Limimaricola variabilis]
MLPKLSNNVSLPELPVWQARSFWAQILFVLTGLLTAFGIDLMAIFQGMGLGATPDAVLDTGARAVSAAQVLIAIAAGLWAWIERRAPNYRLVWTRPRLPRLGRGGTTALFGLLMLLMLGLSGPAMRVANAAHLDTETSSDPARQEAAH